MNSLLPSTIRNLDSVDGFDDPGLDISNSLTTKSTSANKKIHEVDYIGNGTLQISQFNLLNQRTIEIARDTASSLSARGLHHRNGDGFRKDIATKTLIIRDELRSSQKQKVKGDIHREAKPPAHLFGAYFQRSIAFERVGNLNNAIDDYNTCASIDPTNHIVYYNRACVYHAKANSETDSVLKKEFLNKALQDYNAALRYDPANLKYRQSRSIALRDSGQYIDAVNDIMVCRAAKDDPTIHNELAQGKEVIVDSDNLLPPKLEVDPIMAGLRLPRSQRTSENMIPVIDFLASTKFFRKFQKDFDLLLNVAIQLTVITYKEGEVIFEEGEIGKCLYIILGGEISIVTTKTYRRSNLKENVTLVKLYRGDAFGENALDGNGKRTAGAIATQGSQLLLLGEKDYKIVMKTYRASLKLDVLEMLSSMKLFATWDEESLDALIKCVVVESFGPNFQILKEGDESKYFFVIKRGMVKITKSIDKPSHIKITPDDIMSPGTAYDSKNPGLWIIKKNWKGRMKEDLEREDNLYLSSGAAKHQEEFNCGILATGQYFCETSVLNPGHPSPTTITTLTSTEVYKFPGSVLESLGIKYNKNSIETLDESSTLFNPRQEKLAYYFHNKYIWEAKKHVILENISSKRQNGLPLINSNTKVVKHDPMRFSTSL